MKAWLRKVLDIPEPIVVSKEVETLQADWVAENSDAREEGVFRDEYEARIQAAKEAHEADPLNPKLLLALAEAYAIMEPKDPRVVKHLDRLTKYGDLFFDKQRQGDVYQLYGRSLFLAARFEECLEVMLKAKDCYYENGNRKVRRFNNVGLLRVYAALGRSKECAERLEVALTQCEVTDDSMLLYMHAKNALEKTGTPRDAEILDDIWYVFLDTHDEEKKQWENFNSMSGNVIKQCKPEDDDDQRNLAETIATFWPQIKRELMNNKFFVGMFYLLFAVMALWLFLMLTSVVKKVVVR